MTARSAHILLLAPASLLLSSVAWAQGYAPVESDTECREDETLEECRERLCEEDETDEECQRRLEKKREEVREEKQREADEAREEQRERQERQAREQRRRQRGDDDDDDDDYDGGGGSSSAKDLLRPGTRPMFFVGAIGPEFFGLNRDYDYRGRGTFGGRFGSRGRTRGKLSLDFGYHFSGDFEGPAIGASIDQSFDDFFYVFNPAFKFWWDIQPVDDYGIYIAPFAKAGYALAVECGITCPDHAFNLGFGVEGRVLFNDRGIALLRLAQIDTYLGDFFDQTFWINVSILIGGGVTF